MNGRVKYDCLQTNKSEKKGWRSKKNMVYYIGDGIGLFFMPKINNISGGASYARKDYISMYWV